MQYVLYAACVFLYVRNRPLRQLFRSVSRRQRIVVWVFLVGLFAGQVIRKPRETYPFTNWGMYAGTKDRIAYDEYVGVRSDGSEFAVPIADLVRVRDQHLPWVLLQQAWEIEATGDPEVRQLYEETLRSAWRAYRRRHPDARATTIRVYSVRLDVTEYKGKDQLPRRLRWEIRL